MHRCGSRTRTGAVGVALAAAWYLGAGAVAAQVWEVGSLALNPVGLQAGQQFGTAVVICDINGDQFGDLVVGAPRYDSAQSTDAGAWSVYWGSGDRTLTYAQTWNGGGTNDSRAGLALACGDFDHDGRDELAVGQPWANPGGVADSGIVSLSDYQGSSWVSGGFISQFDTAASTSAEVDDHFGYRLTVGDFNGDNYEDLAVGSPDEDYGAIVDAGVVQIFYGSASGLRNDNPRTIFSPNATSGEAFGQAMAAGDFDADGYDDLAVGAPFRRVSGFNDAGAVEVYYGSASGLGTTPQVFDDGDFPTSAVGGTDWFGFSLAAGEFNQTPIGCFISTTPCYRDLAIGVPGQTDVFDNGGKVVVAYGGPSGLSAAAGTRLSPVDVGETPEVNDYFGYSLAAGALDFTLFSYQDLAVATPFEDEYASDDGAVHLVFGGGSGVGAGAPVQALYQGPGLHTGPPIDGDAFGYRLAVGDLDHDGWGDLVVGMPRKGADDTGTVVVLYGALFADGSETQGLGNWGP